MKIVADKPVFAPVTLTLESAEELQFILAVFGHTTPRVELAFGLPSNFMYDRYSEISRIAEQRGVDHAGKLDIVTK